jgi:predicted ATPase/transcriptional regulator with XRE-family HTH domain
MADREPPSLALALQQLRTARGLTQEELAERSSVSIRTISDIERGISRYPRRDTLRLLSAALHLDEDEAALLRPAHYARPEIAGIPSGVTTALSPIIGREQELRAVRAALIDGNGRMVTLTGLGGIGKTRLALEVIATLPPDSAAQVTFVDLAPITHAMYVPSALAHTLGVRERAEQSLTDTLCEELAERPVLLVLDNFEHILAARSLLSMVLKRCPHARLLVTSRRPLEIPGEVVLEIQPLTTLNPRRIVSPELVLSIPAPALFIERASAAQPGFAITPVSSRTIARICALLGGIPLAIELAAAWSDRLSPQEILLHLSPASNRSLFSLLTRRTGVGVARQHSMRDAAAWSYHLLDSREQVMFRRLGVFAGSWSMEAAELICGRAWHVTAASEGSALHDDGPDSIHNIDQDDSVAALNQLVNHSLIFAKPAGDGSIRFGMHTIITSYAQTLLDERKERAALSRRHAEYFADLVEQLEQELTGAQQRRSLMRLVDEYDNIRAALRWTRERHEIDLGLRLAGALWWFWETRGYGTEGREWVEGMLAFANEAGNRARDENVARALYCAAILAAGRHDYAQVEQFGRAFLLKTDQPVKRARMLLTLGNAAKFRGDQAQADVFYTDGLAMLREQNDTRGMVVALNNLSALSIERGNLDRALSLLEESLALKRQLGDLRGIAVSLINLGELRRLQGEMGAAGQTLGESLQIFADLEDRQGTAVAHSSLGELAAAMGDHARAAERFIASLRLYQSIEDAVGEARALQHLGRTYARLGDAEKAQEYLHASATCFEAQNQIPEMLESLVALADVAWEAGQRVLAAQTLDAVRQRLRSTPRASDGHVSLSPATQTEYERLQACMLTQAAEEQTGA